MKETQNLDVVNCITDGTSALFIAAVHPHESRSLLCHPSLLLTNLAQQTKRGTNSKTMQRRKLGGRKSGF
jgi:hypothetical protein